MKRFFVYVMLAMLLILPIANVFAVSESAVLFLLISPGARAAGMGESFVALADDATAVYWNPAGLAFQRGREVTIMHSKWLPQLVSDMSYEFLAYRQYFESLGGTLGGNVTFLNMGEQHYTSEDGPDILDTFTSWDMGITLCYATELNPNLGLGVGMRYIQSNLAPMGAGEEKGEGTGNSFAVDLGILYKMPYVPGLRFGANLSNMGPKITYIDAAQADPLPTNLKIGFAYDVLDMEFNKLTVNIETNKLMVVRYYENEAGERVKASELEDMDEDEKESLQAKSDPFYKALLTAWTNDPFSDQMRALISSIGMEYVYNNMIALRAGYYYDEEGKVKYPTFGAGLTYSNFRFDFAYVAAEQGHPLSDTMRFSLSANF